ncbi:MAG: ATP-binding response regulator [Microcoleaceae cyanobacterium]
MSDFSVPKVAKPDHVLVVDDTVDNLLLVQSLLEEEGYEVALAENGYSALEKIITSPPDLILLDVMMPDMNGYEVTQLIRRNSQLPFIPILLISGFDSTSVVQGLDAGADDFIRKPVEIDELLARVRSLIRLKHTVNERDKMALQREDFVSRLTHDLRTPLIAADRILNLMIQGIFGEISPIMRTSLITLIQSNLNLLNLVNMLLDIYRYEAGAKSLSFQAIDLGKLLSTVVQELEPLATAKNLSILLDLGERDREFTEGMKSLMGDRLELHRLFTNLVGNAIKFTEKGFIQISVTLLDFPTNLSATIPGLKALTIEVADTGYGISPEEQKSLFERFRPGKHKGSGTGLGLHLCRQIVEAHHGIIEVKSQIGLGSIFTVYLPVKTMKKDPK